MKAFISLGSNLGDRAGTLREAVRRLDEEPGVTVEAVSKIRETDPVGPAEQPKFMNAVARVETALEPGALLNRLQAIEAGLGRVRTVPWGPRTLDLDLLIYGERTIETGRLRVPHPRLTERRFVLEPLAEIAPDLKIPGDGRTALDHLEGVPA